MGSRLISRNRPKSYGRSPDPFYIYLSNEENFSTRLSLDTNLPTILTTKLSSQQLSALVSQYPHLFPLCCYDVIKSMYYLTTLMYTIITKISDATNLNFISLLLSCKMQQANIELSRSRSHLLLKAHHPSWSRSHLQVTSTCSILQVQVPLLPKNTSPSCRRCPSVNFLKPWKRST